MTSGFLAVGNDSGIRVKCLTDRLLGKDNGIVSDESGHCQRPDLFICGHGGMDRFFGRAIP